MFHLTVHRWSAAHPIVHEEGVEWQRILWRDSPTELIKEFHVTTVTYGTSTALFLSTRTLPQLAVDEQEDYSCRFNSYSL
ncbi:uncharacterized protein LOC105664202 [Trichonephila inaurata madagascariensis]|uniref:Uncharacterized protein LOC105664202 n=1 Tax=Trichonephila inaurata madagascariensis TaxID=2747483 RepID=A0A8X7CDA8_9ARAC|nr:uncharacterized protein LOC105664202 [Trichonephila inaurata madagascariensis]